MDTSTNAVSEWKEDDGNKVKECRSRLIGRGEICILSLVLDEAEGNR